MPPPTMDEAADIYFGHVAAVKDRLVEITQEFCPKAKVIGRFIYDENIETWGGILKSEKDGNRVHAITIYYDGFDQETDREEVPAGCMTGIIPFRLDFFHQYEKGTDTDNTELRMQKEVVRLAYIFERKPQLDFNDDPPRVFRHGPLAVPNYKRLEIKPVSLIGRSSQFRVYLNPDDLR